MQSSGCGMATGNVNQLRICPRITLVNPLAIMPSTTRAIESSVVEKPRSVLLADIGWSHTLRLANDFAKSGFTVYLLSSSRFFRAGFLPAGIILVSFSKRSPDPLFRILDKTVRRLMPDLVVPLSEDVLFDIWDHEPTWASRVRPTIPPEVRPLYRSKFRMADHVAERGVLVPRTWHLESLALEEFIAATERLGLPIVVKGEGGAGGSQVRIANSISEARRGAIELRERTGNLPVLQECLTGASYLVGGVFDRGEAVRIVGAEETEMLPPLTGPAIELTSRNEPELIAAAEAVFRALNFSGIANADFVRGADGRFRFLEVNPRPWGSFGLAEELGIDLVGSWVRLLRGESVTADLRYTPDRVWAKMPDYLYSKPMRRRNMLARLLRPTALRSWSWSKPRLMLNEMFRAAWTFLRGDLVETPTVDTTALPPPLLGVNNEQPLI